jgi:hypothetical protein
MEDEMTQRDGLTRREFTVASALAMLGGVVITITPGCGGSDYSSSPSPTPTPAPAPTPTPATGDKTGVVSSNHGHTAVITGAQLTAGGALSLDITGTGSHPHTVELAAADLTSIAANTRVSKESSNNNGHSHTVTFN